MADMTGNEYLVSGVAWKTIFTIGQMAVFQRSVNHDFILSVFQLQELLVRQMLATPTYTCILGAQAAKVQRVLTMRTPGEDLDDASDRVGSRRTP